MQIIFDQSEDREIQILLLVWFHLNIYVVCKFVYSGEALILEVFFARVTSFKYSLFSYSVNRILFKNVYTLQKIKSRLRFTKVAQKLECGILFWVAGL